MTTDVLNLTGKSVVVTGGTGFIGRHLCVRLEELGAKVLVPPRREAVGVIDDDSFRDKVDHVFHLAGRTGVVESWQVPLEFLEVNALGTARMAEQCRKFRCPMTMVSAYVYGLPERLPIDETHPVGPNNPYALSKHLAEQICTFYAQSFEMPIVILRLFNVYGPRQSINFLIPRVVSQAVDQNCSEIVVQDLAPRRDYLFITDAVDAIVASITARSAAVFNVGSGVSYSVEQIIRTAEAAAGVNKPYRAVGTRRSHEIDDVVADISAITRELGWRPVISIEQGLTEVVTSMRADAAD